MKYEINCQVIRDLLPLYEDNAASAETRTLVQEHLKDCPDCREELRKMHAPISVPPDDDKDVVKRLREFQAQARRKQNVKTTCVVSVLVLIVVFCLCYTLIPRSWDSVAGKDEADILTGYYIDWQNDALDRDLKDAERGSPAAERLLSALSGRSYRADLSNLLNYTPFPRNGHSVIGASGGLVLYLFYQDREWAAMISLYSNGDLTVDHASAASTGSFLYRTDPGLYEEVRGIIQEYGTP